MKLKSVDISKTASASAIVFDALRKAIIEGELAEGEHLRQDHIAQMFNTSRIPVREALQRLEQESGYYVSENLFGLRNTRIGNVMGLCALTLPTDLPSCGLMMFCPPDMEEKLLRLGAAAEQVLREG